jgi:hypothetical protein
MINSLGVGSPIGVLPFIAFMVSTVGSGVCRLDDTRKVDVPTLRSSDNRRCGGHSFVGRTLVRRKNPGNHINHDDLSAASLAAKNPERTKEFRSSQTPGARYGYGDPSI